MDCKHEQGFLIGTADGILCRRCGRLFKSFDELNGGKPADEPAEAPKKAGRRKKADA
jgi:hypothetical protein